jgi:hypothetical protein
MTFLARSTPIVLDCFMVLTLYVVGPPKSSQTSVRGGVYTLRSGERVESDR